MSAHTPGPWRLRGASGGGLVVERPIQSLQVFPEDDARLIAAAPDLLAELAHLVSLLEPLELSGTLAVPGLATLNDARAAIAKAKGQALPPRSGPRRGWSGP